jgi:hypothetical protein
LDSLTALNQHYLSKFISKSEGTKERKMDSRKAIVKHKMQTKSNISPSKGSYTKIVGVVSKNKNKSLLLLYHLLQQLQMVQLLPQTVLPFSQIPADQAKITYTLLPDNIEAS